MELQLLLLAVDAALYPTLLAVVVVLLSKPRRRLLLSAYLAGGLTISVGVGLAIVAVLNGSDVVSGGGSGLSRGTDLAVGGLALLLAVALAGRADVRFRERRRARHPVQATGRADDRREPLAQRLLARGSGPVAFGAALAINLPGAAYLVALKDIAVAAHGALRDVLAVLVFNVVMFTLAEVALVGLVLAPEATVRLVHRVDEWFSTHSRTMAVVLCTVLGVFLVTRGLVDG